MTKLTAWVLLASATSLLAGCATTAVVLATDGAPSGRRRPTSPQCPMARSRCCSSTIDMVPRSADGGPEMTKAPAGDAGAFVI